MRFIRLVPGIAVPEYMSFLLELCEPIKHTKRAVDAGHLLLIDYHPPYIQLVCRDIDRIIEEARNIQGEEAHNNNGWDIPSKDLPLAEWIS